MKVKDIMAQHIVTVEMDDKLSVVRDIFNHVKFHHLLVVGADKLMGVISDRDLLKALSPRLGTISETQKDSASLNKRVHQIMTRKLIVLHEDADLEDIVDVFNSHAISCIPIVDADNKPLGIISWRDVLRSL